VSESTFVHYLIQRALSIPRGSDVASGPPRIVEARDDISAIGGRLDPRPKCDLFALVALPREVASEARYFELGEWIR
jgi:hypothetical protein